MASVVIKGDTSGQVTISAPAVAGTNTATLPAATGVVMVSGNMPAFSVYASSATNTATATFTRLVFATEEFDTNSNFASNRFTPTVEGYYQISGATAGGFSTLIVSVFKNGTEYKRGSQALGATLSAANVSTLVYLNGSTDYVELYWYQASGSTQNSTQGIALSYFNGCLVRGA
jgi:hypothetical protein